jgi:hypothetical protein
MDQILYLEDQDFCEPFAKLKSGDEVTITVEAVLANAGTVPNFEAVDGKPEAKQRPFMQFVIRSVSNSRGRLLAENDDEEVEEAIAKVKGFDEPFDHDAMEKEIARVKMNGGREEGVVYPSDLKPAQVHELDGDEIEDHEDEVLRVEGFDVPKRKRRR